MTNIPKGPRDILVFGSNLDGRHGKGSALEAFKYYGARRGVGSGFCGRSYAIPTKDQNLKVLGLTAIEIEVRMFLDEARKLEGLQFHIVDIGCGLAGYKPEQIAPFFKGAPSNCHFLGKLAGLVQR